MNKWGLFWIKKSFKDVKTVKLSLRKCWGTSLAVQVKTLSSTAETIGSIPDQGTDSTCLIAKKQTMKQKQYCNRFYKYLIKWPT